MYCKLFVNICGSTFSLASIFLGMALWLLYERICNSIDKLRENNKLQQNKHVRLVTRNQWNTKFITTNDMISFFSKLSLNNSQKPPVELAKPAYMDKSATLQELGYRDENDLKETIYDFLRTIRDPEKPSTLEDLKVIYEDGIFVKEPTADNIPVLRVEYNPTVPHCSLATLIGLCIRIKIQRSIHHPVKLDIYIKKGAHTTEDEINKQINDKERIAAAMENPNLRNLVENCIADEE